MTGAVVDYYTLLNVSRNASPEDIKRSFRELALRFHPDKNPGNPEAEDKFKEINRAYEVLGDPDKRMFYDRAGHDLFNRSGEPGGMHGGAGCGGGRGCGCGRGRGGAMWRHIMENMAIHDITLTRDEAANGAVISIRPENAPDEEAFDVRLPSGVQNGMVLRCMTGPEGDDIFIRIIISDE